VGWGGFEWGGIEVEPLWWWWCTVNYSTAQRHANAQAPNRTPPPGHLCARRRLQRLLSVQRHAQRADAQPGDAGWVCASGVLDSGWVLGLGWIRGQGGVQEAEPLGCRGASTGGGPLEDGVTPSSKLTATRQGFEPRPCQPNPPSRIEPREPLPLATVTATHQQTECPFSNHPPPTEGTALRDWYASDGAGAAFTPLGQAGAGGAGEGGRRGGKVSFLSDIVVSAKFAAAGAPEFCGACGCRGEGCQVCGAVRCKQALLGAIKRQQIKPTLNQPQPQPHHTPHPTHSKIEGSDLPPPDAKATYANLHATVVAINPDQVCARSSGA